VAQMVTKQGAERKTEIKTPKGRIMHSASPGGRTVARLEWNTGFKRRWSGQYWLAQMFMDSEVLRLSDPYVPFLTGSLKQSGTLGTVIGSGLVQYIAPYARWQYYRAGQTQREIREDPRRGPMWFERMKVVYKDYLIRGAKARAGGSR